MALTTTMLPGTTSSPVLLLNDADTHLYLAQDALLALTDDLVKKAIQHCLQHPHRSTRKRLAYDFTRNSETPYLFNCIDLEPAAGAAEQKDQKELKELKESKDPKTKKLMNGNFLDKYQLTMIRAMNKSCDGKSVLADVQDAFDVAEHLDVDGDPG